MYLIIEVFDRELCSVHTALTSREAVDTANRVLKKHCDAIGRSEVYDEAEAKCIDTGNLEQDGIKFSSQDSMDAWCNFKDEALDIFVTRLDETPAGTACANGLLRCAQQVDRPEKGADDNA